MLKGMQWREVGPYRGGRADAVEGIAGDRNTYYFGSSGGGVWKTSDGGQSWKPVSDGFFGGSIGAVTVAPSDPSVVYAGTGEETVRGNVSSGDGLWKSTDGGDTWKELSRNKGMPKGTLGIIGVSVSASNPQNVYAIVEAKDGGVYRSRDGGDTWTKVSGDSELKQRAWYYTRIYADPRDEGTPYH